MDETELLIASGAGALLLLVALISIRVRRARQRRDEAAHAEAEAASLNMPASLHPVIDPDVCIGSLACIKACPEGDILGIVNGAAKLIIGSNCIGHGRCAAECPVSAIRLVVGTSERGVDLPEVDGNFESSRPGVHIVGELGGMGLIRNAIIQGLEVSEHLGQTLKPGGETDVVIVGAGPAGLATALGLRQAGLTFRILEQGMMGGAIAHYPRQKVAMTEMVKLPLWGNFGKKLISKEQLLETWQKIIEKAQIRVEEGVKVLGISGQDGDFIVTTSRGDVRARKVVLATGRRGTPRALGCDGEELPKVTYGLVDPEQYRGKRALVVGGGDSALEAAWSLAAEGCEVTLSYRQRAFTKCRDANRKEVLRLAEEGKIRLALESEVKRVEPHAVRLKVPLGEVSIKNDYVIACLGGELPTAFLKSIGVAVKRYHGEELHGTKKKAAAGGKRPDVPVTALSKARSQSGAIALHPATAKSPTGRAAAPRRAAKSRLGFVLFCTGLLIIAGLTYMGLDYYLLDRAARRHAEQHAFLRPAGLWGHGVGIVATLFMMSNFLYAARKRLRFMKSFASIRAWLTWHMFVGFMSPVAIAFHAAFQSNNLIATSTYYSLLVVVGTGMIGRYVYGLIGAGGAAKELSQLRAELERGAAGIDTTGWPSSLQRLYERARNPPREGASLILRLLTLPLVRFRDRIVLFFARRAFDDRGKYWELRDAIEELQRLRIQVGFFRSLKRFLSVWRVLHVVLAIALVGIMTLHIGISLYLGYAWIFK